ncbi:MAG TPA: glycosyltransferase family A protein [Bacteroidales bacterium]|nr:glycosyltransferase family A protein [Bacteroidales bacterium]
MNISILIPVNNYDLVAFVHSLRIGMENVPEFCEILIGDDGSDEDYRSKYLSLIDSKLRVIVSEVNIGRAAIRNRLITEAKGEFLLFVDADAMLPGTAEAYFQKWLPFVRAKKVISGGVIYNDTPPGDPDRFLRWNYGKHKEQKSATERNKEPFLYFSTFNVLIDRSIFDKIRFFEELKQYGYEDVLFGYQLKKAGFEISHIDNGLLHEGLETNKEYILKTKHGIENLSMLYDNVTDRKAFASTVKILKLYKWIKLFRLSKLLAGIFIRYRDRMEIKLDSSGKSLSTFWFYKISMFCTYREIHLRKKNLSIFRKFPFRF